MPRIGLVSDLHIDIGRAAAFDCSGVDVLVVAGDMGGDPKAAADWLSALGVPVVAVMGNHDHWSGIPMDEGIVAWRETFRLRGLHLIEDEEVVLCGVRFVGSTMWTDYAGKPSLAASALRAMNDFGRIRAPSSPPPDLGRFASELRCQPVGANGMATPATLAAIHARSRAYISGAISRNFDGPTVVVTHHAPEVESLRRFGIPDDAIISAESMEDGHGRSEYAARRAAYASRTRLLCGDGVLLRRATPPVLWLHGHLHQTFRYPLGAGCLLACNPRGYHDADNARFERPMVFEIDPSDRLSCVREAAEDDCSGLLGEMSALRLEMAEISTLLPDSLTDSPGLAASCAAESWEARAENWEALCDMVRSVWGRTLPKPEWGLLVSRFVMPHTMLPPPDGGNPMGDKIPQRSSAREAAIRMERVEWLFSRLRLVHAEISGVDTHLRGQIGADLCDVLRVRPRRSGFHEWVPVGDLGPISETIRARLVSEPWIAHGVPSGRDGVSAHVAFETWVDAASGMRPGFPGVCRQVAWNPPHP